MGTRKEKESVIIQKILLTALRFAVRSLRAGLAHCTRFECFGRI